MSSYKKYELKKLYNHERIRFIKYFGSIHNNSQNQLDGKLIFYSHALEKGLSHINFRAEFGKQALQALQKCMIQYNTLGYSKERYAYKNTLSCLKSYRKKHLDTENSVPQNFLTLFSDFADEIESADESIGGYSLLDKNQKMDNRTKNFGELFQDRVSIREYAPEMVDLNLIKEAIQISTKTPSVCNRQSTRVRVITNSELISRTLKVQGGYTGYKIPPVLLLVTTDTGAFIDYRERNQIYIDGGLFSMALLISIEYVGLGACALNAMFGLEAEREIRNILNIPENENMIVFITVGNLLNETPYPKSFRYSGEFITTIVD